MAERWKGLIDNSAQPITQTARRQQSQPLAVVTQARAPATLSTPADTTDVTHKHSGTSLPHVESFKGGGV